MDVVLPTKRRLEYLPVGLFGSVMGLTGLSIAWRLAHVRYGVPEWISVAIGFVAALTFVLLLVGYAIKSFSAPDVVLAEFNHPIASSLFGTPLISLLLLPIIVLPASPAAAKWMWAVGAVGMLVFAWLMVDRWMNNRQQAAHATPTWIVPVVGLLDVPLALPVLDLPHLHGLMVFCLAVGLFFAIPLFTLIFSRLLFEPPLPDALQPTLMILVAPFAVGTSAYVATTGTVDLFAESLYGLTVFMLAVLLGRLRYLDRCCPFRVSWWAVSFPLAAATIASFRISEARPGVALDSIAVVLLAFTSIVIAGLLIRTIVGIGNGELRALSTG